MKYQEVPVSEAKAIAEKFGKSIVIISAWDTAFELLHTTTYGVSPTDKVNAAVGGETIVKALGMDLGKQINYEDFRREHNAARERALQEAVQKHLPALKKMGAQVIDPPDNVFSRMVADFERALS